MPNPFYGLPNVGGSLGAATVSQAQLLMPFPEYSQVYDANNLGKAQYDSLILKAQKRLSKGVNVPVHLHVVEERGHYVRRRQRQLLQWV